MSYELPHDTQQTLKIGAEAMAAGYALKHAVNGTPLGQEGGLAQQAARTGGNFVIAYWFAHLFAIPYLAVTGVIFALPTVGLLAIEGWEAPNIPSLVVVFVISLYLWVRYAVLRWLVKGIIDPMDRWLTGRSDNRVITGTATKAPLNYEQYRKLTSGY